MACGFEVSATAPLFHFADSMELNDAKSGLASSEGFAAFCFGEAAESLHEA
jgi:hypothetical protein